MRNHWVIGETVVLRITITDPVTGALVDPAGIALSSLKRDDVVISGTYNATHVSLGVYTFAIPTTGFTAGTHRWLVAALDLTGQKAVIEDSFVLAAPA